MNQDRRQRLDNIFEAFSIIAEGKYVYVCDLHDDLSRWSQSAVDYFDLPGIYMYAAGDIWAEHVHPEDRESYSKSIENIFSGAESRHDMQYRALAKDGNYVVCTCRGVVVRDANGEPEFFAGAIQNHSIHSYMDTVTGLRSLYGFFEDLKALFWKQEEGCIMLIGPNNFSNVNDIYGYTFGNSVLRTLGNFLHTEFSNLGAVYRMDGTKFAVISHSLTAEKMKEVYQNIQRKAAHDFHVDSERLSLPLNAGIVKMDSFDISTETIYCCLKYAYYESKNRKLGDAVIFANALTEDNRLHIEKLNVIRNSVAENCRGFFLCYQPIMDANTEELKGMEALIRWKDESYGTVPPVQFIPVLEQDALFPELGRWILRRAMEEGKRLLQFYPDLVMNVNLSYEQLETNTFVEEVLQMLRETGFPPHNLCLEITERCKILDISLLKNMFKLFRENGIKVALDDFGTGFSSLGILREVPVDTIKIDREYVKDVERSKSDQSTVQFISNLADAYSAEVCVEGVETLQMRDCLKQFRVSSFQGYYYSKPITMDEFLKKYTKPEEVG